MITFGNNEMNGPKGDFVFFIAQFMNFNLFIQKYIHTQIVDLNYLVEKILSYILNECKLLN